MKISGLVAAASLAVFVVALLALDYVAFVGVRPDRHPWEKFRLAAEVAVTALAAALAALAVRKVLK